MTLLKFTPHKSKAQAMVEFAIALPILLLLLYGIIETGRLLFMYSTVVTASRQAARYGSATGQGITTTLPRYQDCAGMRTAANNAGYLGAFDTIQLQYDSGPNSPQTTYCNGTTDTSLTAATLSDNEHRIVATVTEQFNPILPNLVPFISRPITATSARTVILSVSIVVTPPFTPTFTPSPTLTPSLTFTPSLTSTSSRTPTITPTLQYTYTPTLTPVPATKTNTLTPTPIPATPITGCNSALTLGLLTKSGNTMSLNVTNSHVAPLQISVVDVIWNHDKGHQVGSDKTLILQGVNLGGPIWSGSQNGPSYPVAPTSAGIFPPGATSTLTFTFHQPYDNWDDTESVTINLATPGCAGVVFFQNQH